MTIIPQTLGSTESRIGEKCKHFKYVKEVKIKVAISSVSCDNAAMNLQAELSHWDFDKVVKMSSDRWNNGWIKMTVESDDELAKRVFYTAQSTMIAPTFVL